MLNSLVVKSILDKKIESGCGSDGYMTKENPTGTGSLSMNRHPTANIGANSTAEGFKCEASGASSHAEGNSTTASGQASHAEGKSTKASGDYSHAEGVNTKASSYYSHAEGFKCEASGYYSHAEGSYTTASASSSHAEGTSCLATAQASHAEGNSTTASEHDSHAEGDTTTASGQASHAEGFKTKASGPNSHAEGVNTEASGYYSHAEGLETKASGSYSHSGGNSTIAGYSSQTAIGEYNENKEEDIFEVGNGTSKTARSNALELTRTGDLTIAGGLLDTVISMIVDHIYEGVDLTVKFASEIANYSDEWAWIKARVTNGNYAGIHVCDYIPITCNNGYILNAQVAGINTYTGYGDQPVGNHIDFICKELWDDTHVMNKVNYNNGNVNSQNPFLASDLNYWINSMSGTVPNSESDPSVTTEVDYTADGVLYYLPDKLKNQIITKRILLPSRYTEGQVLTNDNSWDWQSTGKLWIPSEIEVYGVPCWGKSEYDMAGFVQYPIFDCNTNRAKLRCACKDPCNWWLLSAFSGNSAIFAGVAGSGICNYSNATHNWPVAPVCFRI